MLLEAIGQPLDSRPSVTSSGWRCHRSDPITHDGCDKEHQPWTIASTIPTAPILVTGGTGTLGRLVVARLRDAGSRRPRAQPATAHEARGHRVRDRRPGHRRGDRRRGGGRRDHRPLRGQRQGRRGQGPAPGPGRVRRPGRGTWCTSRSSGPTGSRWPAAIDRAMFGYFGSKLAAERVVAESGLPWTTLRATQFHDLTLLTAQADGEAAGDPGPGRVPVPADRRRRGGGAARRAGAAARRPAWCPTSAGRGCTRWPTWSAATCAPRASAGRSCRSGCPARPPRVPGWREPGPGSGRRPPDLGGLPGRAGRPNDVIRWRVSGRSFGMSLSGAERSGFEWHGERQELGVRRDRLAASRGGCPATERAEAERRGVTLDERHGTPHIPVHCGAG